MIGDVLGQFRIGAMIGAGGMGVVYRARDERLDRDVALKVLPAGTVADEAARKRLRQEAITLSRLNHPNIATVHDFNSQDGVDFLVMELIPGSTLDQKVLGDPLPEKEALRLAIQLAQGLAAAHAEGIVHRDLKPGNVRITPDGRLKILDFGLAMLRRLEPDESADTAALGEPGMVAGSPPYMAPEQLLGEAVDARSDIYAAGAVLYEMTTGRRPFAEAHGARLVDAILHQSPPPPRQLNPRLSAGLELIVLKCLDKEPDRRYQSARELLVDLERLSMPSLPVTQPQHRARRRDLAWTGLAALGVVAVLIGSLPGGARARVEQAVPVPAAVRSVAVLPLANLSSDAAQEYFVDGITDALIADLGRMSSLRVISRTSSMQYKGVHKPLPTIAGELGVEAVLEGSVLRAGDRVRVNAQLVHAATDRQIWSGTYERDLRDVLAMQSEVARTVVREVRATLAPHEREASGRGRPVDPEAHEAYLRGRHFYSQGDIASLSKALDHFGRAVAKDPGHALAHTGLADTRLLLTILSADDFRLPPAQSMREVRAAASRALELDPALPDAHSALAFASFVLDWNWAAAEDGFRKALQLNPSLARAHEEYAWFLAARGRLDEALAEMKRARDLDPLGLLVNEGIAGILMYKGQPEEAIAQTRKTLDLKPDFVVAHHGLGRMHLQAGRTAEGISSLRTALSLSGDNPALLADLAHAYARAGRREEARRTLAQWRSLARSGFSRQEQAGHVHGALGEKDRAFALLEQAFSDRSPGLVWLKVDPRFDPLRSDPRFARLLSRVGLTP